jgi:hypothetical protein
MKLGIVGMLPEHFRTFIWQPKNRVGSLYFYRLQTDAANDTKKRLFYNGSAQHEHARRLFFAL